MGWSRSVLIVEDNPVDVDLIAQAVEETGIVESVTVANDGIQAIEMLLGHNGYKGLGNPDLILMDLNLPGKSGLEVLTFIKAEPLLRQIPVVVLSGSDSEHDIRSAYRLHANCYVTKSMDIDDYQDKVRLAADFWLRIAHLPSSPPPDMEVLRQPVSRH